MNLFQSAAAISIFTLLSRITGLVRDIVITGIFGASPLTDGFWIAFRIPNFLRRLFAEGAFSQVFIPIIGGFQRTSSKANLKITLNHIFLALLCLMSGITIIGVIIAPNIVNVIASGMGSLLPSEERNQQIESTILMTQIMFPYILFISLTAFLSGILNIWKYFAIPAFLPVLLNLSIIGACFIFFEFFQEPIYSLAIGVLIGGILQFVIPFSFLRKIGFSPYFSFSDLCNFYKNSIVKQIFRKMIPAIFSVSVTQISLIINTNIATWLQPGSITWITLSDRLMEFSVSLIGVTLGTLLFTNLSEAYIHNDSGTYSKLIDWAMRITFLFGLPCSIGMSVLSEALVSILFHYGKFTVNDVINTQACVISYSVGLIGFLSVKALNPGFYAQQNMGTPIKISIIVLVATQIMNFFLVPKFGHFGIILAISGGAFLNACLLFLNLLKHGIYKPGSGWFKFIKKLVVASVALYCILAYLDQHINWTLLQSNYIKRILIFSLFFALGALIYFSALILMGIRLKDFYIPKEPRLLES